MPRDHRLAERPGTFFPVAEIMDSLHIPCHMAQITQPVAKLPGGETPTLGIIHDGG